MTECGAQWLDTEGVCTLERGHVGEHWFSAIMEFASGSTTIVEVTWIGEANAKSHEARK